MRAGRFLELYISETRENLELLTRSILEMEAGDRTSVEAAFRAAHTIKGLAATMGHDLATETAHILEDRLSEARASNSPVDAGLTDELLAAADRLEVEIDAAVLSHDDSGPVPAPRPTPVPGPADAQAGGTSAPDVPASRLPAGTTHAMVIRLAPDAALPEARAELIRRRVESMAGVLGVWPARGEAFNGELHVFIGDATIVTGLEVAVRSHGDVAAVTTRDVASNGARQPAEGRPDGTAGQGSTPQRRESSSVRVDRARLDDLAEGIAELSVLHTRASQTPDVLIGHRAAAVLASLQRTVLEMRMVPVSTVLDRLGRWVRDAARSASKEVDFELVGGEIELDQVVLDALVDPVVHLIRNAVDHGIEAPGDREAAGKGRRGMIRIEAVREQNRVRIQISDDGSGVDRAAVAAHARKLGLLNDDATPATDDDILRLLFQPGFSTALAVTELSGRGVGMDVVAGRVRGLGGTIEMATEPGVGTTFTLRVPITLALAHSLRIGVGSEEYALPITHVTEVVQLTARDVAGGGSIVVRGVPVSLVDLGRVLGIHGGDPTAAVVAELGERRVALAVDRVISHEQIVVRPFDAPVGALPVFSGATLLSDGRPALLIDPLSVL